VRLFRIGDRLGKILTVKMLKTWYVVHFLVPTRHTCAPQVSWISGFFASDTSNRRFVHSPQLPVCALMPGA
jgi:hypothetical protein